MKVDVQTHGLARLVVPHGPLTGEDVEDFRRVVGEAVSSRGGRVVVDMRDVPYLDSVGIEALLGIYDHGRTGGARPKLARLSETCREALDLTDAMPGLDVFDSVENALRSFNR